MKNSVYLFICILVLTNVVQKSIAVGFQASTSGDNVQWALNCDWKGGDVGNVQSKGSDCGWACRNRGDCSHFTWTDWNGGTCWMKRGKVCANQAVDKHDEGAVCGFMPDRNQGCGGGGGGGGGGAGGAVQISVTNNCPFKVWMATMPNHNVAPLGGTVGLDRGQSHTYNIPNAGWAGRFWPKIGCNDAGVDCSFGDSSPPCPANGCQPPADTKVEFFFPSQPPTSDSWYDISLVDGYSLPMKIVPRGGESGSCITTVCRLSLDACPTNEIEGLGDLRVRSRKDNSVVACLAPCKRWNYPAPYGLGRNEQQDPGLHMCCPTPPITPAQCSSGPVVRTQYVGVVRSQCPTAYSYAYNDVQGLHTCPGNKSFDVTVCP